MSKAMDKIQSDILRTFHTLCGALGMSKEEKKELIKRYGVESSADIDTHELIDLCNALSKELDKRQGVNLSLLRKRVLACIGGWLDLTKPGLEYNTDYIKAIACKATGCKDFNKIPRQRLQNVYNTFLDKQRDYKAISSILENMEIIDKHVN